MDELNITEICGNCKYFASQDIIGACTRYPQTVNKHSSNSCGEFIESSFPLFEELPTLPINTEIAKRRGRPAKYHD